MDELIFLDRIETHICHKALAKDNFSQYGISNGDDVKAMKANVNVYL